MPLNSSARDAFATLVAPRPGVEKASIKAVAAKWPKAKTQEAFLPVFESQKGGVLSTSAMGQMIADLVNTAGRLVPEETSAHTLRHTFARWYLAQYPSDPVGHRSLDTTRLYRQPSVKQLSTRVEQLNLNAYSRK